MIPYMTILNENYFFFAYSVGSAATSDAPERYERLTSVSSSVDIDQRDTVRRPFILHKTMYISFPETVVWSINFKWTKSVQLVMEHWHEGSNMSSFLCSTTWMKYQYNPVFYGFLLITLVIQLQSSLSQFIVFNCASLFYFRAFAPGSQPSSV